ncbi:MAG: alpha-1,4-glucan--maltose-1-phosphate maltosyltransferase [Hydrogenophaga sp.]|uniref:alpha-1,4-glucan--maltose-1-phosphate maltosyltransferase n=1 Tax=Hydrogenophaga sp. TaxID=1904254 RepID=UPI00262278DC|nr:alpha-1,4-glucan--maltose-1-phosphate maltosyltransferase [Hydrogenophaga sp.]MDM7941376.1 alpha-1,4-glucan--maltose-1-phosphate maltosyltransferase [Hydrogenophaga sp.]
MSVRNEVHPIALSDGRIRVVIENLQPAVDGGRFPIKRVTGDEVVVEADCFADGHDVVACSLKWRFAGSDWKSVPMEPLVNDRWRAGFVVDALGSWEYTVCAWVDPFQSWRHDFARRIDADDVRVAAASGASLIAACADRADSALDADLLRAWARELAQLAQDAATGVDALKRVGNDAARAAVACRHPDLRHAFTHPQTFPVTVERERARFSAWYEFFPRSASDDAGRHGNFADCEAWLPYVKQMGFDVLYFPPIHPVGRSRRKGRNNSLEAKADDAGSPWAIGAAEGGHTAILAELGTAADFRRLVKRANELDIDIALDIAFQCAPDHPWVLEHPDWFKKRADGSIQYAENPPKKYQDIYPFDFESADWRAMWLALAGVFEHWVGEGVRVFRVDNPHTKAYAFWEWVIARVRALQPEVVFLSEAFTRPRVMHRLAKVGFSQSYTYYTWRNTKQEITAYFTELTQGPGREYFRPNVWPNTPDILPAALQYGGRPVFMARVAMAATLAASYGIYGPAYELLESQALRAGGEEYLDSEKFERRVWDRTRADSLAGFIAVLNHARRTNPALQSDAGLRFLSIDNEQMLAYAKTSADGANTVVCVVNLDPHHTQSGWVELEQDALGIQPGQVYQLHDLVTGSHFLWHGARNFVSLDPHTTPVHVMELRSRLKRENDFDYFL